MDAELAHPGANGARSAGPSRLEWAALLLALAGSAALCLWITGNVALSAGVLAGTALAAAAVVLLRQPRSVTAAGGDMADWSVARAALAHDDIAIAISDRAGRLVCANDLYAAWFDAFAVPPALPLGGDGAARLKQAGMGAWMNGQGRAVGLMVGPLRLDADITRAGRADDYLVWRFAAYADDDLVADTQRHVEGLVGQTLGHAGVLVVLALPNGQLMAANRAFAMRALGNVAASVAGHDIARLLRMDEAGMLFFDRESDPPKPVRLVQIPLASADPSAPLLLALLDEDAVPARTGGNQALLENLLAMLPFGLGLVDRDGRFLFINRAFGRAVAMPGGKRPRYPGDIVVTEDKGALVDTIRRHGAGTQSASDLSVRLVSQPDEPVSVRIAGVRGLGDAVAMISLKDGSEENRLKNQVAQASKMQAVGQLAGGVAHDFNNILTAILGSCDLMLMRHTPGDGDYDDVQQIRSNTNRAAALTRQLLAFSRQQTLRPQIVQLPDVISEVSYLLKRLITGSIKLVVRHGRALGAVRADPGQLEQVIINLAVNARDAMPDGGTLTIETFAVSAADTAKIGGGVMPPDDYSALRITDTGSGIPPDVLPKIFEPFFTTKDVGRGTGLGLSTVYGIIKQSAGFIFADSKPGKGTRFTLYLPVHRAAATDTVAKPQPRPKAASANWGSGTVLLVEDEDNVRLVAERALTRAGYTVICAADGQQGLDKMAGGAAVDLVVSDVAMPVMDGPAMVRELRAQRPDLPVLFMSGYAEENLRDSIAIDNVGFLPKPFAVNQLAQAVADALGAAQARRDAAGEQRAADSDG